MWSLGRGAARSGMELLWVATAATVMIPLASLAAMVGVGWSHAGTDRLIDGVAIIGAVAFALMARATRRRAFGGPRDSDKAACFRRAARQRVVGDPAGTGPGRVDSGMLGVLNG